MTQPGSTTVAFIGTGVMGASMAGHLLDAGSGHASSTARARAPRRCSSAGPSGPIRRVTSPPPRTWSSRWSAIRPTSGRSTSAPGGIIGGAAAGTILIDMTTSSRRSLHGRGRRRSRGVASLDAPVSGGDIGARKATADDHGRRRRRGLRRGGAALRGMGRQRRAPGRAGAGQHTKMANQVAIAGSMLATVESLAYAQTRDLTRAGCWSRSEPGRRHREPCESGSPHTRGDFGPGFYVKHFVKDMRIALESAAEMGLGCRDSPQPSASTTFWSLRAAGDLGTQALWLL